MKPRICTWSIIKSKAIRIQVNPSQANDKPLLYYDFDFMESIIVDYCPMSIGFFAPSWEMQLDRSFFLRSLFKWRFSLTFHLLCCIIESFQIAPSYFPAAVLSICVVD